jgi:hypothetical protein
MVQQWCGAPPRPLAGILGALLVHRVRSQTGGVIGTILCECKRARTFASTRIPTLKGKAHKQHADLAVLVCSCLRCSPMAPKSLLGAAWGWCGYALSTFWPNCSGLA